MAYCGTGELVEPKRDYELTNGLHMQRRNVKNHGELVLDILSPRWRLPKLRVCYGRFEI